jgi:hypothetical protein
MTSTVPSASVILIIFIAMAACSPSEPTFARVQAVLDEHCTGCHNDAFTVDLRPAGLHARLLSETMDCWDPESAELRPVPLVTPGIPEQSGLWLKTVSVNEASSYGREMPIGGPLARIAPDDFDVLEAWILAGAPE